MRSESTSAFGQPRLTRPMVGFFCLAACFIAAEDTPDSRLFSTKKARLFGLKTSIMLVFADIFLHFAHLAVIALNLFGWMWTRTRRFNLALLLFTAFCWFGLAPWFGMGYCPLTAWHWQVKQ